jgi:hypothetical protein
LASDIGAANANTFLVYTGNNFNVVNGVYTTSDHVTLTIELSAPLPSNYTGPLPNLVHGTANDGEQTLSDTQLNSSISMNSITTDQNGSITKWTLEFNGSLSLVQEIFSTNEFFFPPTFSKTLENFYSLIPSP